MQTDLRLGQIAAFWPIPGILLRIAILVPLGLYQTTAKTHWTVIERYPKLHDVYTEQAVRGERMAYKWVCTSSCYLKILLSVDKGRINFYYHLAALVPATFLLSPVDIIFALPDIVLLVYLGLTIASQQSYSPRNVDCHDPASLSDPGFLQAAASVGMLRDVGRACREFEQQRKFAVVICTLVASMVFSNICNCFFACVHLFKAGHLSEDGLLLTLVLPFRDLGVLCFWILFYLPCLVFRKLPTSIQSRVLLTMRCGAKAIQTIFRRRPSTPAHSVQVRHRSRTNARPKNTDGTLAKFLSVYDVLVLVTTHLHYVDVANLSLVSRRIHQTLLPAQRAPNSFLRTYTCKPDFKARCYVCLNQICNACLARRSLWGAQLFYDHLFHCLPHCSTCYLRTLREPRVDVTQPAQIDTRRCACRRPTASTMPQLLRWVFLRSGDDTSGVFGEAQIRGGPLLVCRSCNLLSDAQLAENGTRRLRSEMRSRGTGTTESELKGVAGSRCCAGCQRVIGKGRTWWVCEACNQECRSTLHGG